MLYRISKAMDDLKKISDNMKKQGKTDDEIKQVISIYLRKTRE